MTVRWKPLIVLSGLFCVVGVLGLLAILFALPANSKDILPQARQQWKEGHFAPAKIHFERALQVDPKNAAIHDEYARMLGEWAARDASMRQTLRIASLHELTEAVKYDKRAVAPRRMLLADAIQHDEPCADIANDLLTLDPNDADAHYALAADAVESPGPDAAAIAAHLEVLDAREPGRARTEWIKARLAQASKDDAKLAAVLARIRPQPFDPKADPTDQTAWLRLRQIDAMTTTEPADMRDRIATLKATAAAVADNGVLPRERLSKLGELLGEVQTHVEALQSKAPKEAAAPLASVAKELGEFTDVMYRKALDAAKTTDLSVYADYADHLLARREYAAGLSQVSQALKLPMAAQPNWASTAARLREIAVKTALSDAKDPGRFAKADPYIKELQQSTSPRFQALGNLFQGVIDLERSGMIEASRGLEKGAKPTGDGKARIASLEHLRVAAAGLPDVATAQALYGVALMLSGETGLGRQYLQAARRLPNLEPRYQVWSAWASLQAGYPEDAEQIVRPLIDDVARGAAPKELAPTLHLLSGEIHQARRTPDDLRAARDEFQKALADGEADSAALRLRLAQIDILLGDRAAGLKKLETLKGQAAAGPAADHLAVLLLLEQNKMAEARKLLATARAQYPDSEELAGLDAAVYLKEKAPEQADRVLADFIAAHPKSDDVVMTRARLLAGPLNKPDEARKLLLPLVASAETSAPYVQLAMVDLGRRDFEAVAATIAKVRTRWSEAATADLLEAQSAFAQNRPREATAALDTALKKDPSNKVALFWKAQLGDRIGASKEAEQIYEQILRDKPVKELDDGLSLTTAANWALAAMSLENQEPDAAIGRLEGLLRKGAGDLDRPIHWQLASAHAAKGEWPAARREIENLLKDPKKTTTLERVRAANLFRLHGDEARAAAELDRVLKEEPGHPPAVAMRAYILAQTDRAGAAALLRRAMKTREQPEAIHLMLAAMENLLPPVNTGPDRALATIDQGLKAYPNSIELIQAKYRVLAMKPGGSEAASKYIEERAKDDPKGEVRRLMVDLLRDAGRYADAERVLRELTAKQPDDDRLAAMLVRLVAAQAVEAADRGDAPAEKRLNAQTAELIRGYRTRFPKDVTFLQAECELAIRAGKFDEAVAITKQIDALDKNSPIGPTLRAQLAAARGSSQGMAQEYAEAVARAPKRTDLRLALGQASLAVGKTDEAIKQAEWLLEGNNTGSAAVLLKARALVERDGTSARVAEGRAEAVALLNAVLKAQPTFSAAYHLLAEIQLKSGSRAEAVKTLKAGLKAVPTDAAGLSMLAQLLTEPRPDGQAGSPADRQDALALAESYVTADKSGAMALALAIGFHKAGQYDLALPWAETAAKTLGTWLAHLNFADLLLAKAETTTPPGAARALFERAVSEYDQVLKVQANSLEAVNNKAWILHQYLGKDAEALALAEGLLRRTSADALPADFFDTLGAIQEAMSRPKEAEDSYTTGLKKSPDHPMLNYHMGKLLAADGSHADAALSALRKAEAGKSVLPADALADVRGLIQKLGR